MILLLGGRGFIGSAFRRHLDSTVAEYQSISRKECDCTNRGRLISLIRDSNATFLINAAGYTGDPTVDECEKHKGKCLSGNAVMPAAIRDACEECDLPWGHISTGCIYKGSHSDGSGFTETDRPNFSFRCPPSSFYSGSKALGEECLEGAERTFLWRLRLPFNHIDSKRNYLSKLMRYERLLEATNSISQLDESVKACLRSWRERIPFGIYNVTNPGVVTTREVCDLIQKHLRSDKQFDFFADEAEFMRTTAKTPRSSCVLDSSKIINAGIPLTEVHEAIEKALVNWQTRAEVAV
ncbi:MAG: sugar nucleotide-binding protein [Pirellulaceae bacterium]|nr:sugar nucleotide-binding protein [Pirellulaceae bacterium]